MDGSRNFDTLKPADSTPYVPGLDLYFDIEKGEFTHIPTQPRTPRKQFDNTRKEAKSFLPPS